MNKKIISVFLCQILIFSIISFSNISSAQQPTPFDAKEFIRGTDKNEIEDKVSDIENDPDKVKEVLNYVKDNINKEDFKAKREVARGVVEEIISKKAGRELNFNISLEASLNELAVKGDKLKIGINGKSFEIELDKLNDKIKGISINDDGIRYSVEGGDIDISEASQGLEVKDGNFFLKGYRGLDREKHEVRVSFDGGGRVSLKENGEIEFSGGARIYDPKSKTLFEMADRYGVPGYVNFHGEGHVVKRIGNNVILTKEEEDLKIEVIKNQDKGIFILSKNGVSRENFNSYPSDYSNSNSILVDSDSRKVFIPESDENVGKVSSSGNYYLHGLYTPPQGTLLANTTLGFGGGRTFGGGNTKGVDPNNPGGPGGPGGPSGPGGPNLGGTFNSLLPYLLLGGAIIFAIILLSSYGGSGEDEEGGQRGGEERRDNQTKKIPDDFNYNESVSTGRSAETSEPKKAPVTGPNT